MLLDIPGSRCSERMTDGSDSASSHMLALYNEGREAEKVFRCCSGTSRRSAWISSGKTERLVSTAHHDWAWSLTLARGCPSYGIRRANISRSMPGSTVQGQPEATSKPAGTPVAGAQLELECQVDSRFESRGAGALLA